jgi:hypothetical protein
MCSLLFRFLLMAIACAPSVHATAFNNPDSLYLTPGTHPTHVLASVRMAQRIVAFHLGCVDTTGTGITVYRYEARVVSGGDTLNSDQRMRLIHVIEAACKADCSKARGGGWSYSMADRCRQGPFKYLLRIYDREIPLDMVVFSYGVNWAFFRGDVDIHGYCYRLPSPVSDSLSAFLRSAIPDSTK